jgi:hypothetical protein
MYFLLAELVKNTTPVAYGPYDSQQEAEAAGTKLASLLGPYGEPSFTVKELLPSILHMETAAAPIPVPHVCPPPVMVPYPWPHPYLAPYLPQYLPPNRLFYNQYGVYSVSADTSPAVGLATGA